MSAPRPFIKRTDQTGEQEIERLTAELTILAAELAAVREERDAAIRQRDAWAECYHDITKLMQIPEC